MIQKTANIWSYLKIRIHALTWVLLETINAQVNEFTIHCKQYFIILTLCEWENNFIGFKEQSCLD